MLIKYAYVENVPDLSSDHYMDSFDDGEYLNHVAGLDGIELCGWFDLEKTKQVIAAVESVDKTVPVGSNGLG